MLSFAVYAQDEPAAGVQLNDQQLKQETAGPETTEHQSGEMPSESRPAADSETETEPDTETGQDSPNQSAQDSSTGIETRTEGNTGGGEGSADIEVTARSATNNIVGAVLANMVNSYKDEDSEAEKEASLREYPLERHELEYYGDSPRLRIVEGGDSEGSNYFVYRDSYLLISEKESSKYTVSYAEDGTEAYVSPAIPASELEGKTGIVFLTDDVANDDILVFDGSPVYDGESMTVPLLPADQITINQLFSDGKLSMEQEYNQPRNTSGKKMLKGSNVPIPLVDFNKEVKGKNWSAEIDSFAVRDLNFSSHVDIFGPEASVTVSMVTEMSFKLSSEGTTEGRSTAKIAAIKVPIKYVDFVVSYSMQFENISRHKLHVEGNMNNTIGFTLSSSEGREISQFSTPIRLKKFENRSPDNNQPVEFYIGSQFLWQGGALSATIPIIDVEIGPVISINLTNTGGSNFKVRKEKDLYEKGQRRGQEIHTCAMHGEPGCLDFEVTDLEHQRFFFRIDLYFWDKDFDINEKLPRVVRTYNMYESLTYNSGIEDGVCPHRFCEIPVGVWSNMEMTVPVTGMHVSAGEAVPHTAEEEYLISGTTGSNGKTVIYLPYVDKHQYTIMASGKLDGKTFAGSAQMSHYISRDGNLQVNIRVGSDEKVTIKTRLIWNTDFEEKEVPNRNFGAAILRREAGTDKSWERVESLQALRDREWQIEDKELDKFGAEGSRTFLYEYCVRPTIPANGRVLEPDKDPVYSFVDYGVNAYVDASGRLEPGHDTNFYIETDAKRSDSTIEATIIATPGIDIRVNKKWRLTKEGSKAVPVYLAVLRKPEEGWDSIAEEKKVATDWLPVTEPLAEGARAHTLSTTLEQLQDASVVSVAGDISSISGSRLAINEVSGGNSWRLRYIVPKFHKGIKMQFRGGEIDGALIEKLLAYEYDLDADADVKSFGDFVSTSYKLSSVNATTFDADVVNMDPIEEGTLWGTVRWDHAGSNWSHIPETVELTVKKDGTPIDGSPVILKKSDYSAGDDVWVWTLKLDDYDPEAKYTVEEKTDNGRLNKVWVPEYDGLDVYNGYIALETVMVEARVSFEGDPGIDDLTATVKDGSTVLNSINLKKSNGWFDWDNMGGIGGGITIDNVKDISAYKFEVPDVPGYEKFYDEPVMTGEGIATGNLTYSYSVRYMKKDTDLNILVSKEILSNGDPYVPYNAYPDEVTVKLYRDGVWIADAKLHRAEGHPEMWTAASITEDNEGNLLRRLDENGNKYIYTFSEEAVDGFTSDVSQYRDFGNVVAYKITNKWVGSDHVQIKGTVSWKGDEGRERLRPDRVRLSVINSKGDYVRSVNVPVRDDGSYESKYLPRKDSDGNVLQYSILQSKASGYTSTYSEPSYDEETRTWTCDVTNTLTGYFSMTVKKVIDGIAPETPEKYRFSVLPRIEGIPGGKVAPEPVKTDMDITGEGTATAEFLLDKDGVYYYTFKEIKGSDKSCRYDEKERLAIISRTTGNDGKAEFSSWVVENPEDITDTEKLSGKKTETVQFTNVYPGITVEKKWDIDLEGKDRPDSVYAVVQKKNGNKWTDVETVELNEGNNWKTAVLKPDEAAEYRVRELREKGTIGYLTDKIVYDKGDSDKGSATPNEVIYSVKAYTSVLSGEEPDHKTEYQVSYKKDGDKHTVTNKAILKIDTIKRWITTDSDKIPDSVWLVLLCSPKEGALDKAAGIASAAGINISSVLSYEFPVINPISGGINPVDLLSQLTIGVDLSIFSKALPTLSIGKATKDGNWKKSFTVSKYNMGIPMEYKGAELGSEIIRQIIKYVAKVDLPVSYNPIQNFFSIPTRAIRTVMGIEDLDLSGLSGKALEKAKTLNKEDIKGFGPETLLDDWQFMANVINMIIDWDTDDDDDGDPETRILRGSKTWVNDSKENRPDYIKIHIKDGAKEVEDSPVTLRKSDFEGSNEWTWSLKLDADKYEHATFVVTEEWPENYAYEKNYICERDGLNLTNTWQSAEPETLNIQGQKIWQDESNRDGIRPDKVTVYLLADGEKVKDSEGKDLYVETNKAAGWRYFFPNQPKLNEEGKEINYSLEEKPVEGYTSRLDGHNIINTHECEKISVEVSKIWDDKDNQDGIRPKTVRVRLLADGKDTGKQLTLAEVNKWKDSFTDLNKYAEKSSGKLINYTVEEIKTDIINGKDEPGSYKFEVEGNVNDGFTITNTHTPETLDLTGRKTWNDDDNRDGSRPDEIKVRLMANGTERASKTVSAANGWKWTFSKMPKYENGQELVYVVTEDAVEDYTQSVNGMNITNTHTPGKTQVKVFKMWDDDSDHDGLRPERVTVHLLADGSDTGRTLILNEENGWFGSFDNLYKMKSGKEIIYSVSEDPVREYETEIIDGRDYDSPNSFIIINKHKAERVIIKGKKVWDDDDNRDGIRPDSVTVRLYWNGTMVGWQEVTAEDNWEWSFGSFYKNDKGKEIDFTISEDPIEGYSSEISGDAANGFTVSNRHEPDKVQLTVSGMWNDDSNRDGIRPDSATVKILANGEFTGKTLDLSAKNNWAGAFTDLHKRAEGREIKYTVEEVRTEVLSGIDGPGSYAVAPSGDAESGYKFTHTHTPVRISLSGSKTWDDNDDQDGTRPESITVHLRQNGEILESQTVSAEDGWKWTFTNLYKYSEGEEISYVLSEDNVENYTSSTSGMDITNRHTPEKTQVNVYKMWLDGEDCDGKRPENVTVHLLKGGDDTGKKIILSEESGWSGSFTELDKYEYGKPVSYEIKEDAVEGYESTLIHGEDEQENTWLIVNEHEPETVTIHGIKVWDDEDNRDGIRPDSVTARLYRDGVAISDRKATADNDWRWNFGSYRRNYKGKKISYTVSEDPVEAYEAIISGDVTDGFTVSNKHVPDRIQVKVNGFWDDDNNRDGIRPDKVTVKLLADGRDTGESLELREKDGWTGTFTDLYAKSEGKDIKYTVEEVGTDVLSGIDGPGTYAVVKAGDAGSGYMFTHIHTPEKVNVSGSKTWDDNDNRDGMRPESITLRLKAGGKEIASRSVTAADDWKWTFNNVCKYDAGREIRYSIEEDPVDDYTSETSGFDVTNRHSPEKTEIKVSKKWDDGNDHDGIRPDSVTVRLFADGVDTGQEKKLSRLNGWSASFNDLYVYKDGREISYTVEEEKTDVISGVDDDGTYAVSVSGDADSGFTISNTHTPWYEITYDLNGGEYEGSKADISERYRSGKEISIHAAPTRKGYKFLYWKGSEYNPGDRYTVKEDHRFVAQWKKNPDDKGNPDDPDNPDGPGRPKTPDSRVSTGDSEQLLLHAAACMASLLLLLLLSLRRRRQDY